MDTKRLDAKALDEPPRAAAPRGSRGRIERRPACIFLLAAMVGAAPTDGGDADESVSIRVAAIEIERLPDVTFALMEQELAALVEPTVLRLRWRRAAASSESRSDELRVVFLDGPGRGLHADPSVLAAARHAPPDPTIWVYTPSVRGALGPPGQNADSPAARRALGLALGRVLAHELVHVLAPEVPHGHGLMAERFRMVALHDARPALVAAWSSALDDGARAWAARASGQGRVLEPRSFASGPGRPSAAR